MLSNNFFAIQEFRNFLANIPIAPTYQIRRLLTRVRLVGTPFFCYLSTCSIIFSAIRLI